MIIIIKSDFAIIEFLSPFLYFVRYQIVPCLEINIPSNIRLISHRVSTVWLGHRSQPRSGWLERLVSLFFSSSSFYIGFSPHPFSPPFVFSLFFLLWLVSYDPKGFLQLKSHCLVNPRGKRWPKGTTFPLARTHFVSISAQFRSTGPYTSGRPDDQNPRIQILVTRADQMLYIYIYFILFSYYLFKPFNIIFYKY